PVLALVVRGSIARPRTLLLTTSIITSPLTPSDFATSVALPGARPLTSPAESTTAIEGLVEDHSIFTSSRGSPFAPISLALLLEAPPPHNGTFSFEILICFTRAGLTLILATAGLLPATIATT